MLVAGKTFMEETNDAAANDTNEKIPDSQLDDMRALGMYGLMVRDHSRRIVDVRKSQL